MGGVAKPLKNLLAQKKVICWHAHGTCKLDKYLIDVSNKVLDTINFWQSTLYIILCRKMGLKDGVTKKTQKD